MDDHDWLAVLRTARSADVRGDRADVALEGLRP